jgi:hypothetical protein
MLFSGSDLRQEVKTLLSTSSREVLLISAFIKSSVLEEMTELMCHRDVKIYVRWKLIDIIRGVSDFKSLYDVCEKNGYKLYYNQALPAKALIIDQAYALIGSSNYTQSGLGGGHENIEWKSGIHQLSAHDFMRITTSLNCSDLVTPVIIDNFSKAIEIMTKDLDLAKLENPAPILFDKPAEYYPKYRQKLPPFDPTTFKPELPEHREYTQSLGFISVPSIETLIVAIKNSFYGQLALKMLHEKPLINKREKRLRWGDLGYTDYEAYSKNDGLYNLLLWLSKIDHNYSFYRNPNYPKGTCSLNYVIDCD